METYKCRTEWLNKIFIFSLLFHNIEWIELRKRWREKKIVFYCVLHITQRTQKCASNFISFYFHSLQINTFNDTDVCLIFFYEIFNSLVWLFISQLIFTSFHWQWYLFPSFSSTYMGLPINGRRLLCVVVPQYGIEFSVVINFRSVVYNKVWWIKIENRHRYVLTKSKYIAMFDGSEILFLYARFYDTINWELNFLVLKQR